VGCAGGKNARGMRSKDPIRGHVVGEKKRGGALEPRKGRSTEGRVLQEEGKPCATKGKIRWAPRRV